MPFLFVKERVCLQDLTPETSALSNEDWVLSGGGRRTISSLQQMRDHGLQNYRTLRPEEAPEYAAEEARAVGRRG